MVAPVLDQIGTIAPESVGGRWGEGGEAEKERERERARERDRDEIITKLCCAYDYQELLPINICKHLNM